MTTQQAIIRNLFKNKLLVSVMYIQNSFLFSHFESCIRIDIYSNIVSHQEVEDFNEILNYL